MHSRDKNKLDVNEIEFSHAQADAVAELAASLSPHQRLVIRQTSRGGKRKKLYVRKQNELSYVTLSGKATVIPEEEQ